MKKNKQLKSKSLLQAFLLFLSTGLMAQSGLNNLSFENWSTGAFGSAPTGWFGFNLSQQTTGAQQGSNYVRVSNTTGSQGELILGTASISSIKDGAPFTQTAISLTGFYKTSGLAVSDTMGISAFTSKSGSITAIGGFSISGNKSSWTSFSLSFFSLSGGQSDTMSIFASSGSYSGFNDNSVGAVLDLDNFAITTGAPTSIDKNSLGTSFLIFPNPANKELNIISKDKKAVSIAITGSDGRLIGEFPLNQESTKLDLQYYAKGIYFYSVLDSEKRTLLASKLIISE